MKSLKCVGVALAGGAVGAAIGLLLAPAAGRETRRKLTRSLGDGKDALIRNGHRAYEGVAEQLRAS